MPRKVEAANCWVAKDEFPSLVVEKELDEIDGIKLVLFRDTACTYSPDPTDRSKEVFNQALLNGLLVYAEVNQEGKIKILPLKIHDGVLAPVHFDEAVIL
jgi:hypothetical protein